MEDTIFRKPAQKILECVVYAVKCNDFAKRQEKVKQNSLSEVCALLGDICAVDIARPDISNSNTHSHV